ncbi:hypothetical protein L0991_05880 [Vibrio chagasii]|uniref:hypothetical protein n=1 Tax=Vibrio chagasii TaxID=170679 RepID=UPI0035A69110
MYGSEQTRAFCCNCKALTLHKYTLFSNQAQKAPQDEKKPGLLMQILSGFISNGATGDYKCSRCGTYLETPDHLD